MQEKLARLHFDLYGEVDGMPDDQRKAACDSNMDKLLNNVRLTFTRSYTHSPVHTHIHPLIHTFTYTYTRS